MSTGILEADGSTRWVQISKGETHVSVNGASFGGDSVAVEKKVDGGEYPVYDSGTPVTFTAADDAVLAIGQGVQIRLTLSGSTAPSITWSISAIE